MTLLEWIKANAKEGANLGEAEELIKDLDPLKNITTAEQALSFIERNSVFKSALDAETSRRVDRHDEKFQKDKLPGLLKEEREKVMKELDKPETPEQKRIRELEEKIKQSETKEALENRKAALRKKAAELGYDPIKAERFAVYGDDAEKQLVSEAEDLKSTVNSMVEGELKKRFPGGQPPKGGNPPAEKDLKAQYEEAIKRGDGRAAFLLKEQIAKLPAGDR